jgi:hypothetical protein
MIIGWYLEDLARGKTKKKKNKKTKTDTHNLVLEKKI